MDTIIKKLIKFCCCCFILGSIVIPIDSKGQQEEPPAKCHAQSVTLSDGRTGISCLITTGSIECSPCGAFDEDPPVDPPEEG